MRSEKIAIKVENDADESNFIDLIQIPYEATGSSSQPRQSSNSNEREKMISDLVTLQTANKKLFFECRKKDEAIEALKATIAENESVYQSRIADITHKLNRSEEIIREKEKSMNTLKTEKQNIIDSVKNLKKENSVLSARIRQLPSEVSISTISQPGAKRRKKSECDSIYEVERILTHKTVRNKRLFLLRWKNYDESYDTWEKESDLNCPDVLKQYLKSIQN